MTLIWKVRGIQKKSAGFGAHINVHTLTLFVMSSASSKLVSQSSCLQSRSDNSYFIELLWWTRPDTHRPWAASFWELNLKVMQHFCCSVAQSCLTLCDPIVCSVPGLLVPHHFPKCAQVHVHCIGDFIKPSHLLMSSFPSALNPSQHQGLFQWVSRSSQVTKILEFYLQQQFFQWVFRTDFP